LLCVLFCFCFVLLLFLSCFINFFGLTFAFARVVLDLYTVRFVDTLCAFLYSKANAVVVFFWVYMFGVRVVPGATKKFLSWMGGPATQDQEARRTEIKTTGPIRSLVLHEQSPQGWRDAKKKKFLHPDCVY
jgi:hypothetical protein